MTDPNETQEGNAMPVLPNRRIREILYGKPATLQLSAGTHQQAPTPTEVPAPLDVLWEYTRDQVAYFVATYGDAGNPDRPAVNRAGEVTKVVREIMHRPDHTPESRRESARVAAAVIQSRVASAYRLVNA